MKYEIKQLGLGGILDQAISLIRNHFALLFGLVSVSVVPYAIILGLIQLNILTNGDVQAVVVIGMIGNLILALVLAPLINAAVIHAVASLYLSRPTTIGECFKHALSRFLPLLGTSILMGLAIMGGMILLIIPGILFAFWFMLAQQVTVLEGMSGSAALGRSKALMKGNINTGFCLGLVVGVINIGLNLAAGVISQPHAKIVAAGFVQGIATMLATAAMVVFYFSCRCKLDNFDLQMLAEAVGDDDAAPVQEEA